MFPLSNQKFGIQPKRDGCNQTYLSENEKKKITLTYIGSGKNSLKVIFFLARNLQKHQFFGKERAFGFVFLKVNKISPFKKKKGSDACLEPEISHPHHC